MRRKVYLLAVLSAAAARPALAQLAGPDTRPLPLTVGLQAALYPELAEATDPATGSRNYARLWPVLLKAGYQRYRWGVEAGLLLHPAPASVSSRTDQNGTYTTRTSGSAWAVPIVGRLRLAPANPSPWRLDAEAGIMPWQNDYSYSSSFRDARTGQVTEGGSGSSGRGDLPLLLGLGGTYQLTPHFGLTADARLSWSWVYTLFGQLFNSSYLAPVQPACSVGAAYSFGRTGRR